MSTGKRTFRARTFQSRTFMPATWNGVATNVPEDFICVASRYGATAAIEATGACPTMTATGATPSMTTEGEPC